MRPRRFLPSISQLAAFEAVLSHGSTAAAARDLNLAQGTVSRLVQSLERQLGRPLFERINQRLVATAAAHAYGRDVTRALDVLQRSSMQLTANPDGGTLSLAILPTFGARWLAPRLGAFLDENPGITVNFATRHRRFDFEAEAFDAAIHFGAADWPGAGHMELFQERMTACAAPTLFPANVTPTVEDVAAMPLLHLETRLEAWTAWFAAQGGHPPESGGMLFDQFATILQAAASGLGAALLPDYLAEIEITEGRLRPLLARSVSGMGSYWLVWPEGRRETPPMERFRVWLASQIPL